MTELVSQAQAAIAFHRAKHDVEHRPATEFKPITGEYLIIFAVPMRIRPRLTVQFFENGLQAEVTHRTTYEVHFKGEG